MNVLVSVIIPAYNAEKWIRASVESALNQTWQNIEVIVIDDGSNDQTYCILQTVQNKNVKVISQGNRGAAAARNKGLQIAQGDYIQFLDSDDILETGKIRSQLNKADLSPHSMVLLSSGFGTFYYQIKRAKVKPSILWQDLMPLEWLINRFNERAWIINSSWLIPRGIIEAAGAWDENLTVDDDGEYSCRLVSKSEMVKFCSKAWVFYRQSGKNSLSKKRSNVAISSQYRSTELSIAYLRGIEDSKRTRDACLRFLQRRMGSLHKEGFDVPEEAYRLAEELGGKLDISRQKLLESGPVITQLLEGKRLIKGCFNTVYEVAVRSWDYLLYRSIDKLLERNIKWL
ncbi:MAG: glycosyltransferase family 2 protein [Desulfobacteraceae bacterium]|jgi:glycosyltransferase involved in cell wall biosynthesis|nr:MAG: glycosyltransferase family 2 protein [Desulfobacteraceae bacterium]